MKLARPRDLRLSCDKLLFPSDVEAIGFAKNMSSRSLHARRTAQRGFTILDHSSTFSRVKGELGPGLANALSGHAISCKRNAFWHRRCARRPGALERPHRGTAAMGRLTLPKPERNTGNSGFFGTFSSSFRPLTPCGRNSAQIENPFLRSNNTQDAWGGTMRRVGRNLMPNKSFVFWMPSRLRGPRLSYLTSGEQAIPKMRRPTVF